MNVCKHVQGHTFTALTHTRKPSSILTQGNATLSHCCVNLCLPLFLLLLFSSVVLQLCIPSSLTLLSSGASQREGGGDRKKCLRSLPPSPLSYLSFLMGVRQLKVSAGLTYHTVASTTLQATEKEQTAKAFNTGCKHYCTTAAKTALADTNYLMHFTVVLKRRLVALDIERQSATSNSCFFSFFKSLI